MPDDKCPGCNAPVVRAKHYAKGATILLEPEPQQGGGYKLLDFQARGELPAVRPLTPTELSTTSWASKSYKKHQCPLVGGPRRRAVN